jgi:hypothetical protein
MTEDQYKKAKSLKEKIKEAVSTLEYIKECESNRLELPAELFEKQRGEKVSWLESEISKLEKEFEAI